MWTVVGLLGMLLLLGLPVVQRQIGLKAPRITGLQAIRPPAEVSALALQGDVLWAAGQDGVSAIDLRSGSRARKLACRPDPTGARALLIDSDGALWIGHDGGLTRYANGECRTYGPVDGLPDRQVRSLLSDSEGRLWAGTARGAARAERGRWVRLDTRDGPGDDRVVAMLDDRHGGIWFGLQASGSGGLARCDVGSCRRYGLADGLPHEYATALLRSRDGSVWAGFGEFDRGGAAQFEAQAGGWKLRRTLSVSDGLAGNSVRSIHEDPDGVLWFGSEYNGIARLGRHSAQVLGEDAGVSHHEVKAIVQDEQRNLWLGTGNGITRIAAAALAELRAHDIRSSEPRKEAVE